MVKHCFTLGAIEDIQGLCGGSRLAGRDGIRIDIQGRLLAQVIDENVARDQVTAVNAKRLAKRRNQYVNRTRAGIFFGTTSGLAERADAVGVVNHDQNIFREALIILLGQFDYFGERGVVATHSERVVRVGETLVEIGDPGDLEIVVDFLSTDAVKMRAGQRFIIEQWGGDPQLGGQVRRVEPYGFTKVSALGIEEQRVNVIIDFTDPKEHWAQLGHGYQVDVRVVLWEAQDVLTVPLAALFREGDTWSTFVEKESRARLRAVEIDRHNGILARVASGLASDDKVVFYPSDRVRDGVRIEQR